MPVMRCCYEKTDRMVFLGHLEMVRLVERAFRRAGMPLAFSEGYHPHPKISFAAPAPVGITSHGEILEVELTEEISVEEVVAMEPSLFPQGMRLLDARYTDSKKSLMAKIRAIDYAIFFPEDNGLREAFEAYLASDEILHEKRTKKGKRKTVDLAPMIGTHRFETEGEGFKVTVRLATGSEANLNPMTLVGVFASRYEGTFDPDTLRYHRLALFGEEGPLFGDDR